MRKSSMLFTAVFLVVTQSSPSVGYDIDLYQPFNGLVTRLETIKPIDLAKLLGGITKLLACLGIPGNATVFAEFELVSSRNIHEMRWELPANLTDRLKDYVKTPQFAQIHNFVWTEPHWIDVIHFLYKSGFNGATDPTRDIYTWFIDVYAFLEAPSTLTPPLPTGPPTQPLGHKTRSRPDHKRPFPTPSPIWELISAFQQQEMCTPEKWLEIINDIISSQGLQWLELVRFVIGEVNSNPSVHAGWAKITETEKGKSFRTFRQIDEMVELIHHWDTQLKANDLFELIISILESITGINFKELNINVVGNIISILEWLVYGTSFPPPPGVLLN